MNKELNEVFSRDENAEPQRHMPPLDILSYAKIEELQRAKDHAENLAKVKSLFLANISHEIRNSINGVMGMTWLLLETDLKEDQKKFVESIKNSVHDMLQMVNDILDYSKVESEKLELGREKFSLKKVVDLALERMSYDAKARGLYLRSLIDSNVCDELYGDSFRLQQVLSNLISNAVKFTSMGGVEVIVKAENSASLKHAVKFMVKDTGIGVSSTLRQKIFESFQQASPSFAKKYGGTGLGLSICKKLVELMGGSIGFESLEEAGSTFWFTAYFDRINR